MTAGQLALIAALPGHACLLIAALNRLHETRINCRGLNVLSLLALAFGGLAGLVAAARLWEAPPSSWPPGVRLYAGACLVVALVLVPAAAVRRLRRPPAGARVEALVRALAEGPDRAPLIGSGWRSALMGFPGNDIWRLERADWTLDRPDLPRVLDNLSILFLSDLHLTRAYDRRYFEAVLDHAAGLNADLVLFGGDLIDDLACADWVVPLLSRLSGRLGNFAVLGNHDHLGDPGRAARELRRAGFEVVDGRWTVLDLNGGSRLALGGTSEPWGPALDWCVRPEADATVLLSHAPDLLDRAAARGVDLMFSGHTHAGQVRLPVVGPVLMPSRYGRRFEHGFYRAGRTWLYVTRGLGAEVPLRLHCPPELARVTLRVPADRGPRRRRPNCVAARDGRPPSAQVAR